MAAAQTLKTRDAAAATTDAPKPAATPAATTETYEALAAVSPAHSAMVMNKALDNIFASDIDPRMMSHLPDYWQEYFTSKSQHRQYMPSRRQHQGGQRRHDAAQGSEQHRSQLQ